MTKQGYCAIWNENSRIKSIILKYSTPGHSCIQEVDNIHSNIEKILELTEVWSPVSLLRVLLAANKKHPYEIVQMKPMDLMTFSVWQRPCLGTIPSRTQKWLSFVYKGLIFLE